MALFLSRAVPVSIDSSQQWKNNENEISVLIKPNVARRPSWLNSNWLRRLFARGWNRWSRTCRLASYSWATTPPCTASIPTLTKGSTERSSMTNGSKALRKNSTLKLVRGFTKSSPYSSNQIRYTQTWVSYCCYDAQTIISMVQRAPLD